VHRFGGGGGRGSDGGGDDGEALVHAMVPHRRYLHLVHGWTESSTAQVIRRLPQQAVRPCGCY
jgi:hypothetical protein